MIHIDGAEFKKYLVGQDIVQAKLTAGEGFYEVILPNGKKQMIVRWAFEAVATELKDGNSKG